MASKEKSQPIAVRAKQEAERSSGEPTRSGRYFTPAVDIYSSETQITLIADMPGVTKDNLDLDLREGILTVVGRVDDVPTSYRPLQREYEVGGYMRRFTVGEDVDRSGITATLKDGVLTVVLPRTKEAQPRKIAVQAL